jgi:CubicO group peptidase (beta-lactamase class C family)
VKTAMSWAVIGLLAAPAALGAQTEIGPQRLRRAAAYNAAQKGVSMLVMVDGRVVFEDYPNGGSPARAYELASGIKGFSGIMAVAAAQDGLLDLDEKVAQTIAEWRGDARKSRITIRQLLSLTSGLAGSNAPGTAPVYAEALAAPVVEEPGKRFLYGAAPFQVFGEVMRRKLASRKEGPLEYLKRRVFEPIGLEVGSWRRGEDGNPLLATGASLTARSWAKLGELVRRGGVWEGRQILNGRLLDQCFQGTPANPAYGLAWWMNREVPPALRRTIPELQGNHRLGEAGLWKARGLPADLVLAAGAGNQRLYVSRERKLVIVRQAEDKRNDFSDFEFLVLLLGKE